VQIPQHVPDTRRIFLQPRRFSSHTYLAREAPSGGWTAEPTSNFTVLGKILSPAFPDTATCDA